MRIPRNGKKNTAKTYMHEKLSPDIIILRWKRKSFFSLKIRLFYLDIGSRILYTLKQTRDSVFILLPIRLSNICPSILSVKYIIPPASSVTRQKGLSETDIRIQYIVLVLKAP